MVGPFSETLAWCKAGERLIFLDIARDRYFTVPEDRQDAVLEKLGIDRAAFWSQPELLPRPEQCFAPLHASPDIREGPFRLADVAAALWTQRRVESRLIRTSFQTALFELRRLVEKRTRDGSVRSEISPTVRAFEHARLLRSAADRCLPRSMALTLRLARLGHRAHLVIGVKDRPFGAHAWVQHGDLVLNDSLEEVRRYTPILII